MNSKWKSVLVLAALSAVAVFVPPHLEKAHQPQPVTIVQEAVLATPTIAELHGTIRWVNSTTWTVLNDAGHKPVGISSVQLFADRVRVHHTFTANKVRSFQATSDEAFASADVRVGASVGLTYTDIYFYMPSYGSTPVPPSLLSKAGANVWLTGFFCTSNC